MELRLHRSVRWIPWSRLFPTSRLWVLPRLHQFLLGIIIVLSYDSSSTVVIDSKRVLNGSDRREEHERSQNEVTGPVHIFIEEPLHTTH